MLTTGCFHTGIKTANNKHGGACSQLVQATAARGVVEGRENMPTTVDIRNILTSLVS